MAKARTQLKLKVAVVAVLVLIGLSGEPGVLLLAVVVAGLMAMPLILGRFRIDQREREAEARHNHSLAMHQHAHSAWQAEVAQFVNAEQARLDDLQVFYPLPVTDDATRFDVYGGTPHGWRNLLVLLGGSVLGSGKNLAVVDLTGDDLARPLTDLATRSTIRVRQHQLPEDLASTGLLTDWDPSDLAEVLAQAVHTGANGSDEREVLLSTDLLLAAIRVLADHVTVDRVLEGLHVLNRTHDDRTMVLLTFEERGALADKIDLLAQSDRARDALSHAIAVVDRLARSVRQAEPSDIVPLTAADTMVSLRTWHRRDREREVANTLVFHMLLSRVQDGSSFLDGRVLVVAGADRMGLRNLERLHSACRRRGIRLVYLFQHLRDDLEQLIGSADSEVIIMRTANAREGAAAAEFIGRNHSFVTGQITRGFSVTETLGTGTSDSTTFGTTVSRGVSSGRHGSGSNSSTSDSASHTSGTNTTWSVASGANRGTTETRVYEFVIEPTAIASLPDTAFFLIQRGPEGRQILLGDCDPRFYLADRVADVPYRAGAGHSSRRTAQAQAPIRHTLTFVDPSQQHSGALGALSTSGYSATWVADGSPMTHGWAITRHDGRDLDQADQQRVMQIFAAHSSY